MTNPKNYSKLNFFRNFIKHNSLSGNKANLFQYCQNNSELHEDCKYKVFKELIKRGWETYIEPEFKKGMRPDIVAIKDGKGVIIEIVCSENEESKNKKARNYPIDFELFFVDANKEVELCV